MRVGRLLVLAALVLAPISCGDNDSSGEVPECHDHGDCASGLGCIGGACAEVDCLQSEDCAFGEYCSDESWTCTVGCGTDDDCDAGEVCDATANLCVTERCTDTHLDCDIGDICNLETGACETFDGPFCMLVTGEDDPDCPEGFYVRWYNKQKEYYCLPLCRTDEVESGCPYPGSCWAVGVNGEGECDANCPELVAGGFWPG